jgi:hypothetical protein
MKTVFKFFISMAFLFMAILTIEPALGASLLSEGTMHFLRGDNLNLMNVVAATGAGQALSETVTTSAVKTATPNLLRPEISNVISKVRPDIFPMDTILRKVGRVGKCDSREYKFYSSAVRGVSDIVSVAYNFAETDTAELTVTNAHIWLADDIGFMPEVLNNDSEEIRFKVTKVDYSNKKITVVAVNGVGAGGLLTGAYLPAVAQNKTVTRIGNAKGETDAQNAPYANMPSDTTNYVQIFMCQVEESLVESSHNKEVEYNINDFQTDAIYDMRRMAELTMLFGYPKQDVFDPDAQKSVDLMGGAKHFITKSKTYDASVAGTDDVFNTWGNYIFSGNNGSYTRVLFAGNGLLEWMMNIPSIQKQLAANKTEVVAGLKFKVVETFWGDLLIRRHQAFDDVTGYTNNGIVFDIDNVERRIRKASETTKLDLDKTGQRRVNAFRILEEWTVAFRNPDTHCWIINAPQGN